MKIKEFYEVPFAEWEFKSQVSGLKGKPEELVRQWVLKELIDTYKYPKEWFGDRILIEYPVHMGRDVKRCDIAILNVEREPFILIEVKQILVKDQGKDQLRSYLAATYTANIGFWTNGKKVACYRKMRDPNRVINEPDIPEFSPLKGMKDTRKYTATPRVGKSGKNTGQLNVFSLKKFEDMLFNAHCILRDEEGLQPDEAVDEMIKLLYIKTYDELYTIKGEDFGFQEYNASSTEELASNILSLYKDAQDAERKRVEDDVTRAVFDEDLIIRPSTIRKIVELIQGFSISDSSKDSKGRAFENFLSRTFRKGLGQFFTPEPVVDILVGILSPTENDYIIDPACGSGRMITHSVEYVRKNKKNDEQFKIFCESGENLKGMDIARKLTRIADIDAWMHQDNGVVNIDIINIDSLSDFEKLPIKKGTSTIAITNPPFGSNITTKETLRRFSAAYRNGKVLSSMPKEILFLNRCFELVKPGGKIGIVLPDGNLSNSNMKFIRSWYRKNGKLVAVISLPQETFMPFGAGVKTSLAFFKKWSKEEKTIVLHQATKEDKLSKHLDKKEKSDNDKIEKQKQLLNYDVYMAKVDNIGYNAIGQEEGISEADGIIKDFHQKKGWK